MSARLRNAVLLLAALGALSAPAFSAPAQERRSPLGMLDQLEPGSWDVLTREAGSVPERICLRGGRRLIQLRHPADNCQQLVIDDQPGEVTVQYTCQGKGYGRTKIRRETSRLVQIESQGIAGGSPFAFTGEARRIGGCTS